MVTNIISNDAYTNVGYDDRIMTTQICTNTHKKSSQFPDILTSPVESTEGCLC